MVKRTHPLRKINSIRLKSTLCGSTPIFFFPFLFFVFLCYFNSSDSPSPRLTETLGPRYTFLNRGPPTINRRLSIQFPNLWCYFCFSYKSPSVQFFRLNCPLHLRQLHRTIDVPSEMKIREMRPV